MTMTPQEAAALLDGVEYVHPLEAKLREMRNDLVASNLVVAYGASDDLLEFVGAIDDEVGAWEGKTVHLTAAGLLVSECKEGEDCPYFSEQEKAAVPLTAVWAPEDVDGDPSWLIKTDIPHVQFKIMEDGAVFGIGIVFNLDDVGRISCAG